MWIYPDRAQPSSVSIMAISDASEMAAKIISALKAKPSEYLNSVLWNCGFYIWFYGMHGEIKEYIGNAEISRSAKFKMIEVNHCPS